MKLVSLTCQYRRRSVRRQPNSRYYCPEAGTGLKWRRALAYHWPLCAVSAFVVLLSVLNCAAPVKPVRPSTLGITLPIPVFVPSMIVDSSLTIPLRDVRFHALVTTDGRLEDILPVESRDSLHLRHYTDFIALIKFQPGLRDSIGSRMHLPMVLRPGETWIEPRILFPVNSDSTVTNTELYLEAISLNGIEIPSIKAFPSYGSLIRNHDYHRRVPYKIIRLSLNSEGKPDEIFLFDQSFHRFSDQILSAVNWGDYSPMKSGGKTLPSVSYLVVSFFPGIVYPSAPLGEQIREEDTLSLLDHIRVRLFPDTVGLMTPAVPVTTWTGLFKVKKELLPANHGPYPARIAIDTLGKATLLSKKFGGRRDRQAFKRLVLDERFYPAMDFRGRPHPFEGIATMTFITDSTVSIHYRWLPEPAPVSRR